MASPNPDVDNKVGFFRRILGRSRTGKPSDDACWTYADGRVTVDLARTPELADCGTGIRIEGDPLPGRVLLIRGDDGELYAFENVCTHGGRRLDPVSGAGTVQCCSVGKSTFDYRGARLKGSGKGDVTTYPVEMRGDKAVVLLEPSGPARRG